jgi:hypothetical protein
MPARINHESRGREEMRAEDIEASTTNAPEKRVAAVKRWLQARIDNVESTRRQSD